MSPLIKVLSIDGGGIRGIIPAMVLAEIESRTKKPVAELFHLVSGTSTGGILALGLTKPGDQGKPRYRAADLIALYEKEGERIFNSPLRHKLRALGNLVDEKYPAEGIEGVLEEYFGETKLAEALVDVIVTTYEIERRSPFFFKSRKAKENPDYDFPMKRVARATSAAPTYFSPLKLETSSLADYYTLIDGGVYANNPAMCGYVEAKTTYPEAAEFLVVSLGTGELTRRLPYEEAKDWGLVQWAVPLLNVVFDGVSDTVHYQMQQLLPRDAGGQKHYYRFQASLAIGNDDMDDASSGNLHELKLLAEELINKNADELESLCKQLLA